MIDPWTVVVLTRWRVVACLAAVLWWLFRSTEWSACVVEHKEMVSVPCGKCGRRHWIEAYPEHHLCPDCVPPSTE